MLDAKPGMFSNLSLVMLRIQEVTNYCWRPLDFDMNTNDHLHRIFSLFGWNMVNQIIIGDSKILWIGL